MPIKDAKVVGEMNHHILSSLAAVRNALYLAELRCRDAEVLRYLQIAEDEVTAIARSLHGDQARATAVPIPKSA